MSDSNLCSAKDVQDFLKNGQFDNAVKVARDVLQHEPDNVFCLSVVAQSDFSQGKLDEAKATLSHAHKIEPQEINVNRSLGLISNRQGLFAESKDFFLESIKLNKGNPEILLDVMLMGISIARINESVAAEIIAWTFSQSPQLQFAYKHQNAPPMIKEASTISNTILRDWKYNNQKDEVKHLCLGFEDAECQRIYDFLDIFHGFKQKESTDSLQNPTYHAFPGLSSKPFYEPNDYPWSIELTSKASIIKDELLKLFKNKDLVKPYIDGQATQYEGLNELANSLDWSSVHLIKAGETNDNLLCECPVTQETLTKIPLPELKGNGPEVFLSVLKPGATIKPHHGLSNIKLTVHLGLDVPKADTEIKVGTETRSWKNGELLIFDDTFEHSAWNKSDQNRYVLILEVWHPDLTELERNAVQKIQSMHSQSFIDAQAMTIDQVIEISETI